MKSALAEMFDGFLVDLDGVVYVGDRPLPGAVEALARLRAMGKRILFVTNDPRSSRADYAGRLERMGIEAASEAILTAGFATAAFISEHPGGKTTRVFVVGSMALKAEMVAAGLIVVGEDSQDADFVAVGGHTNFDYSELRAASRLATQGAELVATGRDATFPMPDGPWPGTGAILASIETASGIRACVIGKPEAPMFAAAKSLFRDCERVAMIGDTLASDIEGGRRAGLTTILVGEPESGAGSGPAPDYTISALREIVI